MLAKAPRDLRSWEKLTRISLFSRSQILFKASDPRDLQDPASISPESRCETQLRELELQVHLHSLQEPLDIKGTLERASAPGPCQQGSKQQHTLPVSACPLLGRPWSPPYLPTSLDHPQCATVSATETRPITCRAFFRLLS